MRLLRAHWVWWFALWSALLIAVICTQLRVNAEMARARMFGDVCPNRIVYCQTSKDGKAFGKTFPCAIGCYIEYPDNTITVQWDMPRQVK